MTTIEEIKEVLAEVARRQQAMIEEREREREEERARREEEHARREEERARREEERARWQAEYEVSKAEREREHKKLERTVRQTNKQLGELGNKLGGFAEGLAYPTVERIMLERFKMERVGMVRLHRGGETIQIDALGVANSAINRVIVGEIKSHFQDKDVAQLEKICLRIPEFMPEHRDKQIFGMMIFVQGDPAAIDLATKRGIYTVQANDENFKLRYPKNFVPRDFGQAGA